MILLIYVETSSEEYNTDFEDNVNQVSECNHDVLEENVYLN